MIWYIVGSVVLIGTIENVFQLIDLEISDNNGWILAYKYLGYLIIWIKLYRKTYVRVLFLMVGMGYKVLNTSMRKWIVPIGLLTLFYSVTLFITLNL